MYDNTYQSDLKSWELKNTKEGKLIQSNLLNHHGFKHGFFSKNSENKCPDYLSEYLAKSCSIHFAKQIHSSNIVKASTSTAGKNKLADGIISDKSNQSLWVYTADCIPILFADKANGNVAVTHAGWKGLRKNIINNTIKNLQLAGSNIKDLIVALGPAISGIHYQVDLKIVEEIIHSFNLNERDQEKNLIQSLYNKGALKDDYKIDKFNLDIRLVAIQKIEIEGITADNISINQNCTYSESDLFNSWRRDKVKTCQWSGIVSKNRPR